MLFVKDFLAKNNVTTPEYLPFTPEMAPYDFYLFPPIEGTVLSRF
jgi:hypothetical protein